MRRPSLTVLACAALWRRAFPRSPRARTRTRPSLQRHESARDGARRAPPSGASRTAKSSGRRVALLAGWRSTRTTRTSSCASRTSAAIVTPACSCATRCRRSGMPGTTSALYVAPVGCRRDDLCTGDARRSGQGTEAASSSTNGRRRQNPPGMQLRVQDGADGWKDVRVQVRGDVSAPPAGRGAGPAQPPPTPSQETFASLWSAGLQARERRGSRSRTSL